MPFPVDKPLVPFTPFHFGPALLFGLLLFRRLDLPTFLAANVIVDARATLVFFDVLDGPLHGPFHAFLGSAVLGALLAGSWYALKPWFDPLLAVFRVEQPRSGRPIAAAALLGVWCHVVLDGILYPEMTPFAPLAAANPFPGLASYGAVYGGCVLAGLLGAGLYGLRVGGVAARWDRE